MGKRRKVIELKFDVGDTVYYIAKGDLSIHKCKVGHIRAYIYDEKRYNSVIYECWRERDGISYGFWGDELFASVEDAENSLKE